MSRTGEKKFGRESVQPGINPEREVSIVEVSVGEVSVGEMCLGSDQSKICPYPFICCLLHSGKIIMVE